VSRLDIGLVSIFKNAAEWMIWMCDFIKLNPRSAKGEALKEKVNIERE
jgi:hypothetical protein